MVGLASRQGTGQTGARIPAGARYLSFLQNIHTSSGDHLAFYSIGFGVSSPGLEQPGRETNQLHTTNDDVKNE